MSTEIRSSNGRILSSAYTGGYEHHTCRYEQKYVQIRAEKRSYTPLLFGHEYGRYMDENEKI